MLLSRVLFLFLIALSFCGNAKNLSVSILEGSNLTNVKLEIERGTYSLIAKGKVYTLKKGAKLYLKKGLQLSIGDSVHLSLEQFSLKGQDYVNHFSIQYGSHKYKYDDDLSVRTKSGTLHFVNDVDLDHYVAGVVEGEAGYHLPLEYYKLQAILCRTYALKNMNRHIKEGFNLCDKVHCQVYHKKCTKNDIVQATASTSGLVVVDNDLNLINTTFHSNCGGQTCNSEDVWVSKLDYLRSVPDTFCIHAPHSRWKRSFPQSKFESILQKNGQLDSLEIESIYQFCQDTLRHSQNKLIFTKLTKMRSDFGLNSTYFSIEKKGGNVVLHGKGFGHGVGLCQEGGIFMARQGYSYVDILKYYYTSIHIVNQKALLFFKEE